MAHFGRRGKSDGEFLVTSSQPSVLFQPPDTTFHMLRRSWVWRSNFGPNAGFLLALNGGTVSGKTAISMTAMGGLQNAKGEGRSGSVD
jgi:hypothetical protein